MSTDKDLTDVKAWAFYYAPEPLKTKLANVLARLEASEETLAALAGEPAMLDRLRAAEAENKRLVERGQNLVDGIGMEREMREAASEECREWQDAARSWQDNYNAAEAQRDALAEARDVALIALARRTTQRDAVAEALRRIATSQNLARIHRLARAALAEAGLE